MKPRLDNLLRRSIISLTAFGIIGLYALLALNISLFNPISKAIGDYSIDDFYYQILASTATPDTSTMVTIVDMSQVTDHGRIATIFQEVERQHPKVIGVDIVFEGLKENHQADMQIAMTSLDMKNTYFSYKLIDDSFRDGNYHKTIHSFFAHDITPPINEGFTNMPRNLYGGIKRKLSLGRMVNGKLEPSFAKQVADCYSEKELRPLTNEDIRINYSPTVFPVVPCDSIAQYRHLLEDRIVLIGGIHEEKDMHYTPVGKIDGVKLQGYAIETLIMGNSTKSLPLWLTAILSFIVVLFAKYVLDVYDGFTKRRSPLLSIVLSFILIKGLVRFFLMAFIVWVAFILFCKYNISFNTVYALSAMAFLLASDNIYEKISEYLKGKRQKRAKRKLQASTNPESVTNHPSSK